MTQRNHPSPQKLLFAAAAGDQDAWRVLVERYSVRVFALIRSQGVDPELAEEITQSTFATMAAKLREYSEVGRFEAWLFRIAMNRLRDEMRRRKRQASAMDDETLIALAGTAPEERANDPAEATEIRALRRAMADLSDADREVIQLRHYGGLSFRQIAETLGQPLGTVLARQHRALQKLADLIDKHQSQAPRGRQSRAE